MTQETSEQRDARWRREQDVDAVAIRLGFAFQTEHRGACYWNGNGDSFRAGYEAGKAAEREACAQIPPQDAHPAEGLPAQAMQLSESRNRRVYVAGPMTGMPDYNFPAFNAAASMLRAKGWHVENPAEHGIVAGATWADYMHYDLARIATCSAIYLLPGWCQSRGAALEVHIASALGMTFQYADGAERYHPPSATNPTQQGLDAQNEWEGIHTMPTCDDLIWLYCQDTNTIDGPIAPDPSLEDYGWTHWAYANAPSTAHIDAALAAQAKQGAQA